MIEKAYKYIKKSNGAGMPIPGGIAMKKDEKMMQTGRVVLAPDSFKGTLSAEQVCAVLEQEIHAVKPNSEIISLPVADGGEGTVDAFEIALKSRKKPKRKPKRKCKS